VFSSSLMPMAFDGSHSLEAARAAALAAHSAAGLASSAGLREAARLLRSSEALARAAVAAIQANAPKRDGPAAAQRDVASPSPGGGAAPAGHVATPRAAGTSPASRPRRRRRKKKVTDKNEVMECGSEVVPTAPCVAAPALSADATVFVPAARPTRVLAAHSSRERTPPRSSSRPSLTTACSSLAPCADSPELSVGCLVILTALVSRAELVGMAATVLSFDEATCRYAIKMDATGETVRVLAKNLKPSIVGAGFGVI
jgi:hypothetical protein